MLHRDYILQLIEQFCEVVGAALRRAFQTHDMDACHEVEAEVGAILDMDPALALSLSPDSLVSMLVLSGIGSSVADYVRYALSELSDVYDDMGEEELSRVRLAQAAAISESFGLDMDGIPEGF